MLLVKTILQASTIHGIGCFAVEAIPAGRLVWEFDESLDRYWEKKEILRMPLMAQRYLYTYVWKERFSNLYGMYGDSARFVNHSVTPKLSCSKNESLSPFYRAHANFAIAVGDELTWDYKEFDDLDFTTGNLWQQIQNNCSIASDNYESWIDLGR